MPVIAAVCVICCRFFCVGFAERISTAVNESVRLLIIFYEHARSISGEVLTMATDINNEAYRLVWRKKFDGTVLERSSGVEKLFDAIIFDGRGRFWRNRALRLLSPLPISETRVKKRNGEVDFGADETNKLRAVVKLKLALTPISLLADLSTPRSGGGPMRLAASIISSLVFNSLISRSVLPYCSASSFDYLIAALWVALTWQRRLLGRLGQ